MSHRTCSAALRIAFAVVSILGLSNLASAQEFKAPAAQLELKNGDSLVFLGDSITHQCLYTQYVEDFFYTRYPKVRVKFHNAGVGGARAWDALKRFDRDVAAYKPKYVTILLGMNDGSYQPYDDATFQTYRKDMLEVVQKIRDTGATPILMTPTMYDSRAARVRAAAAKTATPDPKLPARLELYNATLAYYGSWLREVAVESGAGFVDMYSLLNNLTLQERKANPNFTMIKDAVHPDAPGQLVMAFALLSDMGLQKPVSSIRIVKGKDGVAKPHATGGTLSGLKFTDDGVEFTWLAESLPFVVPAEAQEGAKLLTLGHRMSREALEVQGLAPGQYELTIGDQVVGTFDAAALARHIELQENAKTPQYQQALAVAELNQKRNAGPVRSLRNEWSQMQAFYRLQRQVKENPNNADFAKNLEAQTKKVEGVEQRIAQFEKAANEIEDNVFAINQPKALKYQLKRSGLAGRAGVDGIITLNGKPLADAEIVFHSTGRKRSAKTDAEGKFVLNGGAAPGTYAVTVSKAGFLEKYGNPETSGLTATIEDGKDGRNEFRFEFKR